MNNFLIGGLLGKEQTMNKILLEHKITVERGDFFSTRTTFLNMSTIKQNKKNNKKYNTTRTIDR